MKRGLHIGRCIIGVASLTAFAIAACSSFSEDAASGDDAGPDQVSPAADAGLDVSSSTDAAKASRYRDEVLADGPIAYWRMGTKSGGVVVDETDGGNPLSMIGTGATLGVPGAIPGDDDTAIHFAGSSRARATNPVPFHFPGNAPFTVELWAKRDRVDVGDTFQYMIDHAAGNGPNNRTGWALYVTPKDGGSASSFETYRIDAGESGARGKLAPDAQWVHYVATLDPDTLTLTVYVDGAPESPVAINAELAATAADLLIGGQSGTSRQFPGAIDEVAIYAKVLPKLRIEAHLRAAGR